MHMARYVVLKKNLYGKPELVRPEEVMDRVDADNEWYQSLYYYDEQHKELLSKQGHLRGVTNVKTDKLFFDFDSENNQELARKDALEVIKRLKTYNIKEKNIEVYFSSNKGFNVSVTLNNLLNPTQLNKFATKTAEGLETFDESLYDASQIVRVPFTKNSNSKLHKIPLTIKEIQTLSLEDIKKKASNIDNVNVEQFEWEHESLNEDLFKEEAPKKKEAVVVDLDFTNKPRHWPDYKWALLNAVSVKENERHEALMRIAATCRGLGYPQEMAKALCETFDEKFQANTKKDPVEDLETNILPTVYSSKWNGGTYSIKTDKWLQGYADRVGIKVTDNDEDLTIEIDEAFDMFKDYAVNIDKLTVKSGIESLDKNLRMTIGMSVGILAGPGAGKTTFALQVLNNMSNAEEQSIFFSYDMYHALVFQKLVQKHLKVSDKEIFNKFKNNDLKFQEEIKTVLKKEYKNVEFCFKTGQSPDDIEKTIKYTEEKTGKKVRLAVVDYSELVLSDYADSTQNSAFVAQKLREIATKLNICVVVLLQPSKISGSPADELRSYRAAKGSSSLEQSLSIMLGMSRPGYDPRNPQDDQFITINCLKNRMGSLFSLDLGWNGAAGEIYELDDQQSAYLLELRERKKLEEETKNGGWN